jgi:RimJ/RimL family protein N-acetyltransferase
VNKRYLIRSDIRLEPLADRHLGAVEALLEDPDVLRFTRVPVPPPSGFARTWLSIYEAARVDGSAEGFAALDESGAVVGLGLAPTIDRDAAEVELGYIVAPAFRGRGAGTAILGALTDWAFAAAGAERIYLIIDVENIASARVAERCGYTREGVARSLHLKAGVRIDAAIWSRLPSD